MIKAPNKSSLELEPEGVPVTVQPIKTVH